MDSCCRRVPLAGAPADLLPPKALPSWRALMDGALQTCCGRRLCPMSLSSKRRASGTRRCHDPLCCSELTMLTRADHLACPTLQRCFPVIQALPTRTAARSRLNSCHCRSLLNDGRSLARFFAILGRSNIKTQHIVRAATSASTSSTMVNQAPHPRHCIPDHTTDRQTTSTHRHVHQQ